MIFVIFVALCVSFGSNQTRIFDDGMETVTTIRNFRLFPLLLLQDCKALTAA